MAARFWVAGGTGNWNDTSNWSATSGGASGASVPGSADTATLDAASGSGTVTLDISPDIQTLSATFAGTLAFGTNTISLNGSGTIYSGAGFMLVTGTPLIICTYSGSASRTIAPGTSVPEANSISFRVTAGTGTFAITSNNAVRDLDFTDGTNPTGYAGAFSTTVITVYGSLKASTGMTVTGGTSSITFAATSGTKTINTAGVTFDRPFIFNGVGGTWQLQAALTSGSTRACTLTAGTLDLNGYTATFGSVSSSNSNARTFAFGTTGKFVLLNSGVTVWTTSTATNLTVTGTNPLIQLTTFATTGTRGVTMGAAGEANAISVDVTAGSDTIGIGTTNGSFKNVNFTGFTGTVTPSNSILVFGDWNFGGVTAVSGTGGVTFAATSGIKTITSNGVSFPANAVFNGLGGSWVLQDALTVPSTNTTSLTAGTLDLNGYTLTTGIFAATGSVVRRLVSYSVPVVLTGNSAVVYNSGTTGNFTVDVTPTFNLTYSGSVGTRTISSGSNINLVVSPNINVLAGSDTIATSGTTTLGNVTFTSGFTGTFGNQTRNIYGNLTLVSGMSLTSGSLVNTFNGVGAQTITTAGQTLDFPVTFNGVGGSWAMQDALTLGATQTLTIQNGTLQLKAGTTNTVGAFATTGTNQKFLASTVPGSQATISASSGTFTVNYLTIQDNIATGGASWDATGATNVDAGNNTGWVFSPLPSVGNEITMRLRSFTQPRRF